VGSLGGLLAQRRETSVVEPEEQTALHLHILHVQTHREGYRQLLAAVPMLIRDPGLRVSKELYPTIARELGYSDGRAVERSIRSSITAAWNMRDEAVWSRYFPQDSNGHIPCPSNKQFISRTAQMIRDKG